MMKRNITSISIKICII
uniref:Uncharacterized protein n=1 Tax=Anguilla anguilla TaxID=7936 RepID=A0A0E9S1T7_ANGAN